MNGKVRIYELSKELSLESKDILAICDRLDIAVKSHSSTISDSEAQRIRNVAHHLNRNQSNVRPTATHSLQLDQKTPILEIRRHRVTPRLERPVASQVSQDDATSPNQRPSRPVFENQLVSSNQALEAIREMNDSHQNSCMPSLSKVNQELKAPNKYECEKCGIKISGLDILKIDKNSKEEFILRGSLEHCFFYFGDKPYCIDAMESLIENSIDLLYKYRLVNVIEIRCKNCNGYIKDDREIRKEFDGNIAYIWNVLDSWQEVIVCYCMDSYRASIVMCRVTLEEMLCEMIRNLLPDHEVDDQDMPDSISGMMNRLRDSSIINDHFRCTVERVRYISNQFIHSYHFKNEQRYEDEVAAFLIKDMSNLLKKFIDLCQFNL